MSKLMVKERVIYDNYDLWETYPDEELKKVALECEWVASEDEITDNDLMNWRYEEDSIQWECTFDELKDFFKGKTVGFFGSVGLWTGIHEAGRIGEFEELFYNAVKDCDYVKFYDENGHMYLRCSHHDGTNSFEIKILTDKGREYLERWEYNWNDKRSEREVHHQIAKRYSRVPNFCHKVYGQKLREYEPQSKEKFISMLNNEARSFYA